MRKGQMQAEKRKGPGRPATGTGELIGVRLQPGPLGALDAFVAEQEKLVSRPEAIRVILMNFLRRNGYLSNIRR
jgi:hypothetical protein